MGEEKVGEGKEMGEGEERFMLDKPGPAGGLTSTKDGLVYIVTLGTSTLYSINTTDVRRVAISWKIFTK